MYLFCCCSDAIASSESIRLAPSLRSQKGAIWTKQPVSFDWWEVEIAFRVSGRGRVGADGLVRNILCHSYFSEQQFINSFSGRILTVVVELMIDVSFQAFWYTVNKGAYDGPVFGSSDKWIGLGVFFDSFDNDNKHNNPYISAVLNDGTREFDHLS